MNIGSWAGMLVGGLMIVFLMSVLLEWAIFKRVVDTAPVGITLSVVSAMIIAFILYGFGNADGGPWNPIPGGVAYIIAGVIVLPLRLLGYRRRAAAAANDEGLEETFR
jgi:hypothetical protein